MALLDWRSELAPTHHQEQIEPCLVLWYKIPPGPQSCPLSHIHKSFIYVRTD
jgi:hypothetical protein